MKSSSSKTLKPRRGVTSCIVTICICVFACHTPGNIVFVPSSHFDGMEKHLRQDETRWCDKLIQVVTNCETESDKQKSWGCDRFVSSLTSDFSALFIIFDLRRKHALFLALRCAQFLFKLITIGNRKWKVLSGIMLYGGRRKYIWHFHVTKLSMWQKWNHFHVTWCGKKKSYQAFPVQPAPIGVDCLSEVLPGQIKYGQRRIIFPTHGFCVTLTCGQNGPQLQNQKAGTDLFWGSDQHRYGSWML